MMEDKQIGVPTNVAVFIDYEMDAQWTMICPLGIVYFIPPSRNRQT